MRDELHEIPARDLAGAVRNVAVAEGIALDKAREQRGEPTQIIEHRTADVTLEKLKAHGMVIEGTAEEVATAELPRLALPAQLLAFSRERA